MKENLRFGVIGCGFWADYQIAAWKELKGIELVAVYNRTPQKAHDLAGKYQVPHVYEDAEDMFRRQRLDFVDIITDVNTHAHFTLMAARHGVPVICQKPMAASLDQATLMLESCKSGGIPLYIHENFRWQAPIRKVKELLDSHIIGELFKGRVSFCSAYPVITNQPFLAELEEFILTDIGSHVLDVCRFLFGEAASIYCQTSRVNPMIKGEDVANISMKMLNGIICTAEMSYASILETEVFPQTMLLIEGARGSIRLDADYKIKITTREGTTTVSAAPVMYPWLDPTYAVVHSSIVDCNRNILQALQGRRQAETTGIDNLETVRLVWSAYESALHNKVISLPY
jgi:predicted dehydrogenase